MRRGEKEERLILRILGPEEGLCFDIDMLDAATGERLGTGTDCITVLDDAADGNGIQLIGTMATSRL